MGWQYQAYGLRAFVNDDGEILAQVRAEYGCYLYGGRKFIDCESAQRAAERDLRRPADVEADRNG